ncbi:MAG: hypothetical protein DRP02_03465 [Candidatus Gerdarchaeota archaeon]|nr:MAG: hypothetical protein DRP02_03465 [Candidatus Gerdarchaeota archaeon]
MTDLNAEKPPEQLTLQQIKLQLQSTNPFERFNAVLYLKDMQTPEVNDLLKTIINKDPDYIVCELALLLLFDKQDRQLFEIVKHLFFDTSEHRYLRARAIWIAGKLQTKEAYQILLKALNDTSEEVKYWAIIGLQNYNFKSILDQLLKLLTSSRSQMIRRAVIWLLGKVQVRPARVALEKTLQQDTTATNRMLAAWALHRIKAIESIQVLCRALEKESFELAKREIVFAIGNILQHHLNRKEEIEGFEKIKDIAVRILSRTLLRDQSYIVRRVCAEALGKLTDQRTVPNLVEILGTDTNPFVRREIILSLGKIGDPSVKEALKSAKKSNYKIVSEAAYQALQKLREN